MWPPGRASAEGPRQVNRAWGSRAPGSSAAYRNRSGSAERSSRSRLTPSWRGRSGVRGVGLCYPGRTRRGSHGQEGGDRLAGVRLSRKQDVGATDRRAVGGKDPRHELIGSHAPEAHSEGDQLARAEAAVHLQVLCGCVQEIVESEDIGKLAFRLVDNRVEEGLLALDPAQIAQPVVLPSVVVVPEVPATDQGESGRAHHRLAPQRGDVQPRIFVADRIAEVEPDASERVHHGLEPWEVRHDDVVDGDAEILLNGLHEHGRAGVERRIDPVRAARTWYRDIGVAWNREHHDLVRLRHESHDDDHVGALASLGKGVAERGDLTGVADERPGVGPDEEDVDGCAGGLRSKAGDREPLDRAKDRVDVEPTAEAECQHQDDEDRDADEQSLGPSAMSAGAMRSPAMRPG